MKFEKEDGSLTGGLPATYLIEPVNLRSGSHEETVQFIVAMEMSKTFEVGIAEEVEPNG